MANIVVRKAENTDDYKKIASCIYITDPFIYPVAFGVNIDRAVCAISKLMTIKNGLFHPDNVALAFYGKEVSGVLVYNKNGATWNSNECITAVQENIPSIENFIYASDEYFVAEAVAPPTNHIEVIACSVMPKFRNMGVGKKLLNWLIQEYPEYTLTLDVLANNQAAINLYKRCGFRIVEEIKGFSLKEELRPDCYRMERRN